MVLHVPAKGLRPGPGGIRGTVCGFSRASARRLRERLIRIDYLATRSTWATVTYHDGWRSDPEQWHAHLHRLELALARDWPRELLGGIWRLEFQKRGAPHFHLLLFWRDPPRVALFRAWLASRWNAIAEPGDDVARRVGTQADPVTLNSHEDVARLLRYLAKYLAKPDAREDVLTATGGVMETGRCWGQFLTIPLTTVADIRLDDTQRFILARRVRRWRRLSPYCQSIGKRFSGFLLFGGSASLLQLFRGLDVQQVDEAGHANAPP